MMGFGGVKPQQSKISMRNTAASAATGASSKAGSKDKVAKFTLKDLDNTGATNGKFGQGKYEVDPKIVKESFENVATVLESFKGNQEQIDDKNKVIEGLEGEITKFNAASQQTEIEDLNSKIANLNVEITTLKTQSADEPVDVGLQTFSKEELTALKDPGKADGVTMRKIMLKLSKACEIELMTFKETKEPNDKLENLLVAYESVAKQTEGLDDLFTDVKQHSRLKTYSDGSSKIKEPKSGKHNKAHAGTAKAMLHWYCETVQKNSFDDAVGTSIGELNNAKTLYNTKKPLKSIMEKLENRGREDGKVDHKNIKLFFENRIQSITDKKIIEFQRKLTTDPEDTDPPKGVEGLDKPEPKSLRSYMPSMPSIFFSTAPDAVLARDIAKLETAEMGEVDQGVLQVVDNKGNPIEFENDLEGGSIEGKLESLETKLKASFDSNTLAFLGDSLEVPKDDLDTRTFKVAEIEGKTIDDKINELEGALKKQYIQTGTATKSKLTGLKKEKFLREQLNNTLLNNTDAKADLQLELRQTQLENYKLELTEQKKTEKDPTNLKDINEKLQNIDSDISKIKLETKCRTAVKNGIDKVKSSQFLTKFKNAKEQVKLVQEVIVQEAKGKSAEINTQDVIDQLKKQEEGLQEFQLEDGVEQLMGDSIESNTKRLEVINARITEINNTSDWKNLIASSSSGKTFILGGSGGRKFERAKLQNEKSKLENENKLQGEVNKLSEEVKGLEGVSNSSDKEASSLKEKKSQLSDKSLELRRVKYENIISEEESEISKLTSDIENQKLELKDKDGNTLDRDVNKKVYAEYKQYRIIVRQESKVVLASAKKNLDITIKQQELNNDIKGLEGLQRTANATLESRGKDAVENAGKEDGSLDAGGTKYTLKEGGVLEKTPGKSWVPNFDFSLRSAKGKVNQAFNTQLNAKDEAFRTGFKTQSALTKEIDLLDSTANALGIKETDTEDGLKKELEDKQKSGADKTEISTVKRKLEFMTNVLKKMKNLQGSTEFNFKTCKDALSNNDIFKLILRLDNKKLSDKAILLQNYFDQEKTVPSNPKSSGFKELKTKNIQRHVEKINSELGELKFENIEGVSFKEIVEAAKFVENFAAAKESGDLQGLFDLTVPYVGVSPEGETPLSNKQNNMVKKEIKGNIGSFFDDKDNYEFNELQEAVDCEKQLESAEAEKSNLNKAINYLFLCLDRTVDIFEKEKTPLTLKDDLKGPTQKTAAEAFKRLSDLYTGKNTTADKKTQNYFNSIDNLEELSSFINKLEVYEQIPEDLKQGLSFDKGTNIDSLDETKQLCDRFEKLEDNPKAIMGFYNDAKDSGDLGSYAKNIFKQKSDTKLIGFCKNTDAAKLLESLEYEADPGKYNTVSGPVAGEDPSIEYLFQQQVKEKINQDFKDTALTLSEDQLKGCTMNQLATAMTVKEELKETADLKTIFQYIQQDESGAGKAINTYVDKFLDAQLSSLPDDNQELLDLCVGDNRLAKPEELVVKGDEITPKGAAFKKVKDKVKEKVSQSLNLKYEQDFSTTDLDGLQTYVSLSAQLSSPGTPEEKLNCLNDEGDLTADYSNGLDSENKKDNAKTMILSELNSQIEPFELALHKEGGGSVSKQDLLQSFEANKELKGIIEKEPLDQDDLQKLVDCLTDQTDKVLIVVEKKIKDSLGYLAGDLIVDEGNQEQLKGNVNQLKARLKLKEMLTADAVPTQQQITDLETSLGVLDDELVNASFQNLKIKHSQDTTIEKLSKLENLKGGIVDGNTDVMPSIDENIRSQKEAINTELGDLFELDNSRSLTEFNRALELKGEFDSAYPNESNLTVNDYLDFTRKKDIPKNVTENFNKKINDLLPDKFKIKGVNFPLLETQIQLKAFCDENLKPQYLEDAITVEVLTKLKSDIEKIQTLNLQELTDLNTMIESKNTLFKENKYQEIKNTIQIQIQKHTPTPPTVPDDGS